VNTINFTALASSGGGIAAVAFLVLPLDQFDQVARYFSSLRRQALPILSAGKIYRQILEFLVTPDTLPYLQGRLQIATTLLPFFQRRIYVGPYTSVQEVIAKLEASAYIPTYFPRLPHSFEVDGGFSRSTTDLRASLVIAPKRKATHDVFMNIRLLDYARVMQYDELLASYRMGYQLPPELIATIARKLAAHQEFISHLQDGGVVTTDRYPTHSTSAASLKSTGALQ
jgi:hypothetical protein